MSVMTNGGTVIFNDPVTEDGTTSSSLTMLGQLDTARIVALDKKGGTHACGMYVHGFASADASRKFPAHQLYKGEVSLPLSAIDQFLFQTRETKKITFKNIVVQPGVEPKPDGEPMDQSSAVETEDAAASPESPTPPDSMPDDSPPAVEKAEAQACQFEDLRTMRMYASAVGIYYIDAGSWPRNLEALIEHKGKKFISELHLMENHATGKMEKPLYHGGPNLQVEASKCSILAAPSPDREGKRMVGFLDGSVQVIDDEEYQKQLEHQQKPPMEHAVDALVHGNKMELIAFAEYPSAGSTFCGSNVGGCRRCLIRPGRRRRS